MNYVRVPREGGVWKNLYIPLLWGGGGQTHSYVIFSKLIFYIRNRAVNDAGIIFHLRLEGKKRIRMSCFFYLFYKELIV